EQSAFWRDETFCVWRRARFDRWTPLVSGRVAIVDYKTATSADPVTFGRKAADYGYHMQNAWYIDAAKAVGLDEDPAFLFVVQEKTPPYLVSVVELDATAVEIGAARNARALSVYRECMQTGAWPGYDTDVHLISLPAYVERAHEQEIYQ